MLQPIINLWQSFNRRCTKDEIDSLYERRFLLQKEIESAENEVKEIDELIAKLERESE